MPRKTSRIPLVPPIPGYEEEHADQKIVSLQIRIGVKWAELFRESAQKAGDSPAVLLIDMMRFTAEHGELYSKWWMETKRNDMLENMVAISKTIDGLSQYAAKAEKLKKAKESRAKAKPKKPKK